MYILTFPSVIFFLFRSRAGTARGLGGAARRARAESQAEAGWAPSSLRAVRPPGSAQRRQLPAEGLAGNVTAKAAPG